MKSRIYLILLLTLGTSFAKSQEIVVEADSVRVGTQNVSTSDSSSIATAQQIPDSELVPDTIIAVPLSEYGTGVDSLYISRLAAIISPIEFPYNSKVRSLIEFYTIRKKILVEGMLGLSEYYFPMFEAELDLQGLPLELKFLPVIESALNPRAFSRAGASGLWQFMYGTGRMYGLTQTSYLDERRDPVKATKAAVSFLKDLYSIYGDWYLVIAAYNCGPGNVNKAIKRSGGKKDYWAIYPYLPKETRGYAPAFIAAAYVMTYYKEENLIPNISNLPSATDTIMVTKPLHFDQISRVTNISMETLRDLNPQYKHDIVPAERRDYPVRIPFASTTKFLAFEDSIYTIDRLHYFPKGRLVANPSEKESRSVAPKGKTKLYYTVQTGDVLATVASLYSVNIADLRDWNNIRRHRIRPGQRLIVFVPNSKVAQYQKIKSISSGDKLVSNSSITNTVTGASVLPAATLSGGELAYYIVRRGDNLWSIAKRYPGVSNSDIMQWNSLESDTKLSVGQKLKIYKKI